MKYAEEINGKIKVLSTATLKYYKGWNNFGKLPDSKKAEYGVFPLITPEITASQKLGQLIQVEGKEEYTYTVLDKTTQDYENEFNSSEAEQDVYNIFSDEREALLLPYQYNLVQNLGIKNFHKLKQLADLMYHVDKVVTEEEYNSYFDVFVKQNINLTNY